MGIKTMRELKQVDVRRSTTLEQMQAIKETYDELTRKLEQIDRERNELIKNMLFEAFTKSGKSIEEALTFFS